MKRRNSIEIMRKLIVLVKPMKVYMMIAVILGVLGFLLSFGIGIFGAYAFISTIPKNLRLEFAGIPFGGKSFNYYIYALLICALLRGVFHYIEQFCNHFIAFKILAEIRHKVFAAMRRLVPAKLECENPGKLISMIMGDIELLEVFYAHTISPILIAFLTSIVLFVFFVSINPIIAIFALIAQIYIGVIVPISSSKRTNYTGVYLRRNISLLNGKFLDELRGIRETIQYDVGQRGIREINRASKNTIKNQSKLRMEVAKMQSRTDRGIIVLSMLQLLVCYLLYKNAIIDASSATIAVIVQISTFSPYIALANLGTTLAQTLACGDRIISLLEEDAEVEEVEDGQDVSMREMSLEKINFSYKDVEILSNLSLNIGSQEIIGIMGKSGSGKSTLLKLMMRFWDVDSGSIKINEFDIRKVNTKSIYSNIDYMTQSTVLFAGTIRENLLLANRNASEEELISALKKASIYDHILKLENGLDSRISELGDNFSGGERQRLGLARCFLTNSKMILLDEPSSNLDSHNEAIILRSLTEMKEKLVIIVSHRESTMGICKKIYTMKDGKLYKESNLLN